jgi:hypothetical protein
MNQANTPTSTVALVHWKNHLDILKSKENLGLQSLANAQNIPEFYQASILLLQTISERIAVGIAAIHLASYRRDDYFLEARKDILNCISMLERVYSHYLDVPFSDYSEMQKQILHIDEMERYKHISQLGFYITLLEHVHPSMDKWQWVFAEIKGRFAIVAKNSIDLSSLHTLLQPGAPHLAERHSYITWVVGLLEKIAEDYRLKYEVVSYNSMDFYRAISYLSGLKRFYLFIGRDNQITEITKKIEIWEAKLLNDERKKSSE